MKFLIDAQLPPALVSWLRAAGHEAEHVREAGLLKTDDEAVWKHALQTQAIIMTKDEDFAAKSARTAHAPIILWLRIGNATNRVLQPWLEQKFPAILDLIKEGNKLIEVR